jgi:ribonuclease P protein component
VVGRLLQSFDFERVLASPPCARSAHFAVHHMSGVPSTCASRRQHARRQHVPPGGVELSTGPGSNDDTLVDEICLPQGAWVGTVVPKRHARRAVTRNLLKRQIRQLVFALSQSPVGLPAGLWVVRLKAPFDRKQFLSPASQVLREAAAHELGRLFEQALPKLTARQQRAV